MVHVAEEDEVNRNVEEPEPGQDDLERDDHLSSCPHVEIQHDRDLPVQERGGEDHSNEDDREEVMVVCAQQHRQPPVQGNIPAIARLDHEIADVRCSPLPPHGLVVALLHRVHVVFSFYCLSPHQDHQPSHFHLPLVRHRAAEVHVPVLWYHRRVPELRLLRQRQRQRVDGDGERIRHRARHLSDPCDAHDGVSGAADGRDLKHVGHPVGHRLVDTMVPVVSVAQVRVRHVREVVGVEERVRVARRKDDASLRYPQLVHHVLGHAPGRPVLVGRLAWCLACRHRVDRVAEASQPPCVLRLQRLRYQHRVGVSLLHRHAQHDLLGDRLLGDGVDCLPELADGLLVAGYHDRMPHRVEVRSSHGPRLALPVVGLPVVMLPQQRQPVERREPHDPEPRHGVDKDDDDEADGDVGALDEQPRVPKVEEEGQERVRVDRRQPRQDRVRELLLPAAHGLLLLPVPVVDQPRRFASLHRLAEADPRSRRLGSSVDDVRSSDGDDACSPQEGRALRDRTLTLHGGITV
mmetsp:Transcript_36563/g.114192  ORF Transcript_36563/g.114192 Transcript_36563/m.114192 type:complete len:520 (+) Transcript_36563:399-1958(+)